MNTRRPLLIALLLLASGCGTGEAPPHRDLVYRVEVGEGEIVPGRAFPLTVVRGWSKSLVPGVFDPRDLSPLTLVSVGSARLEDSSHVEETLRFRAYAFTLRDVKLPALAFRAAPRAGGEERRAIAEPVHLQVRPELSKEDASPPELPGVFEAFAPSPWPWVGAAALLLLAGLALLRRRPRTRSPGPTIPGPEDAALLALAEARDVRAIADVLRSYIEVRFSYPAPRRTTEEVQAAVAPVEVLRAADAVKFAGAPANDALLEELRERAAAWIRETTP